MKPGYKLSNAVDRTAKDTLSAPHGELQLYDRTDLSGVFFWYDFIRKV